MSSPGPGWRGITRAAWPTLLELVFPQFCKQCDERIFTGENHFFCLDCWERAGRIESPYCTHCGRPHPGMIGFGMPGNYPCADCRDRPNPQITHIRGAAPYAGAVAEAIKLLKFHGRERIAEPLADLMAAFAQDHLDTASYTHLIAVPLHRVRERERGFNQSRLLATRLLTSFPNAQLDEQLQRIRPTFTQSSLRAEARGTNVRGAFAYLGERLDGARVLLIDDVVTTAGTVTECARALRKAGASRVDVLAAALAVPEVDLA